MSDQRRLSDHPTDRLIRELIQIGRPVEQREIDLILDRMAAAPFDPRIVSAPSGEYGLVYQGRIVRNSDDALFLHLVRRVVIDEQWALGITQGQFLDDLRRSIRFPDRRLVLYQRRGGNIAATLSPTDVAVAQPRQGRRSLPELCVVYSADRGIILTGYQVMIVEDVSIPEDAVWLL